MTMKKRYLDRAGAMPSPNKHRQVYGAALTHTHAHAQNATKQVAIWVWNNMCDGAHI